MTISAASSLSPQDNGKWARPGRLACVGVAASVAMMTLGAAAALGQKTPLVRGDSPASGAGVVTGGQVVSSSDGSATYHWDPDAVLTSQNQLITSNPSAFTGPNVAPIVGADTFYINGYTGSGTVSLNVEAGHIWDGHESLVHVTSRTNAAVAPLGVFATPAYDRHATWVGMIIGGRNGGTIPGAWQTGIAPGTDLRSGAIATSWIGAAYASSFNANSTSQNFPYEPANGGFGVADVINSSWGALGAPDSAAAGGVDGRAMSIDALANGNRLTTFVVAAGSSGPGANTVVSPASGYNGITVGALSNDGANGYSSIAAFSSRGPQDYRDPIGLVSGLRAAVDIVAPGDVLTSAYYGGTSGGNDSILGGVADGGPNYYSPNIAGTSFSAPIVTGSVALMHEAADDQGLPADGRDARVIKANLLNAAAKIPGWNNAQGPHPNGNGGVRTSQGLDFASGAGALDMDRTYTQYLQGETDIPGTTGGTTPRAIGWDYGNVGSAGSVNDIVITTPMAAGSEFRATLTWFRERTYINSTTQTDVGQADLDLELWDSTFTTLYSDSINYVTPVEHLAFTLPVTGTYGIRVRHFGDLFGTLDSEEYGLAWWGTPVPEPATWLLFFVGLTWIAGRRNRVFAQ